MIEAPVGEDCYHGGVIGESGRHGAMTTIALLRPLKLHSLREGQFTPSCIRVKGAIVSLARIAVNAPTFNAEEKKKGAYYGDLQDTDDRVLAGDMLNVARN